MLSIRSFSIPTIPTWLSFDKIIHTALMSALLITIIAVFVPLMPEMPSEGLDPSWMFGINQAVAQNLSFGKDIIFTFGPYGSVYTKIYHPSTDLLMIISSFYLAISYWLCLFLLIHRVQYPWILSFIVVIAGLSLFRDSLLFSYAFITSLVFYKRLNFFDYPSDVIKYPSLSILIIFFPFGLLVLIKSSLLIICISTLLCCALYMVMQKKYWFATMCVIAPIISTCLFWKAAGQNLVILPQYIKNTFYIIAGYTEAMSTEGQTREIIIYIIGSIIILSYTLIQNNFSKKSKFFLFFNFSIFLFLAFKAGFVRHDGHALIAGSAILIAALFAYLIIQKRLFFIFLSSLLVWAYIDGHYFPTSTLQFTQNIKNTYTTSWNGLKIRIRDNNYLKSNFDSKIANLRTKSNYPKLEGTSDIYSTNQSYLISSGNLWNPRPIIQSYSAYNTSLAILNKNHLLSQNAPNNLFFSIEPIDGRLPSMEDGTSWSVILENYKPFDIKENMLILKQEKMLKQHKEPTVISQTNHFMGELINVPKAGTIYAELNIKHTLFGRLLYILFKSPQLQITLNLRNGSQQKFRIISEVAKSEFMLSPLIEKTQEFLLLYDRRFLENKDVNSFIITSLSHHNIFWKKQFSVTFKLTNEIPSVNLSRLISTEKIITRIPKNKIEVTDRCDGFIDNINNISPLPNKLYIKEFLSANGWLVSSLESGTLPRATYLVLSDDKYHLLIETHKSSRSDVSAYFNNPSIRECGYTTFVDLSGISGQYMLALALKDKDNIIKICPQYNIPITVQGNTDEKI